MMISKNRLCHVLLLVALQGILLLIASGSNSTVLAQSNEIGSAVHVRGIYVAHEQATMSFREKNGVVHTYQVSDRVQTIYTDTTEIDWQRLIYGSLCELEILNDVIQKIKVLEEPS